MLALAAAPLLLSPAPQGFGAVTRHDPTRAWQGLNLHVKETGNRVRVVDMDGALVHRWDAPPDWTFGNLVKPLDDGAILAILNGPPGRWVVELDWDGNPVWSFDPQALGYLLHHDFERLANGHTLLLTSAFASFPNLHPQPMVDDIVLEVDPAGQVVWSWSMGQHADQLPLSASAWSYLYNLPAPWQFHANSVQSLPANPWEATDPRFAAGNLLLSLRCLNLILVVDRASGDVVWTAGGTIGQHHARLVPEHLPGAGKILLLDNGGVAGAPPVSRSYSRAIQIHPLTLETEWEYATPRRPAGFPVVGGSGGWVHVSIDPFFYTPYKGAAQRLPNGNVLITESEAGRVFEITRNGQIVWQYEQPAGAQVPDLYRWYRVDAGWPSGPVAFPW